MKTPNYFSLGLCLLLSFALAGGGCSAEAGQDGKAGASALNNPFYAMNTASMIADYNTTDSAKALRAQPKFNSPESQAALLKGLGYAGIGTIGFENVPQWLKALDAQGLQFYSIYSGIYADTPWKYDLRFKDAAPLLKGRPTTILIPISIKGTKPSDPAGDELVLPCLREMADLAAPQGLRLALYPHFGSWLETAQDAVRLIKKADRPNVGVCLNLCHWLRTDDPANLEQILRTVQPYLFHVTINGADTGDTRSMGFDRLIQPLGSGSYDAGAFLKAVRKAGYQGPIGLQGWGVKGERRELLARSMAGWKKLSKSLAAR